MLYLNLLQKYKQNKLVETCKIKHIPIIEMKDIAVTGRIAEGPHVGMVCHAHWTKPDPIKMCTTTRRTQSRDDSRTIVG